MDIPIQDRNVSVFQMNGTVPINVDAVHALAVVSIIDRQFSVIHISYRQFFTTPERELGCRQCLVIVPTVKNTVEHNHVTDRVFLYTIRKRLPCGFIDEALIHQCLQIGMNSTVCWCENRVVTTCRKQLPHRGLSIPAQVYAEKHIKILTVDTGVFLHISDRRLVCKYITIGFVYLFRAGS